MWELTTKNPPVSRYRITHEPINISFDVEASSAEYGRWQYFSIGFGRHTHDDPETLKTTWPREAIAKARKALDDLEAKLG